MNADALMEAGLEHHRAGRLDEAEAAYQQILAVAPNHADALQHLGIIAAQRGRLDEGIERLRQVVEVQPSPQLHVNLGLMLRDAGRAPESIENFRAATQLAPQFVDAWSHLGSALKDTGDAEGAIVVARHIVKLAPTSAFARINLGIALAEMGRLQEAMTSLEEGLRYEPRNATAWNVLGQILGQQGRSSEAEQCFRRAIDLDPTSSGQRANLGNVLHDQRRVDEAFVEYETAVALQPANASLESNLLLLTNFLPNMQPQDVFQRHQDWGRRHGGIRQTPKATPAARNDGRIRIGYVSPDFRQHPVTAFFEPLLAAHDRSRFHITCYASGSHSDPVTQRIAGAADAWRDIGLLGDEQAATQVAADGIDILIDLAGHTAGNRLGLFALKPAPVAVTWLGYPNTTGLASIDYRITDALADPVGLADELNVEKLVRLPRSAWCYRAATDAPPVAALPAATRGYVTFGSFNYLGKINLGVIAVWAKLLKEVPNSRLTIKAAALADERTRRTLLDDFIANGIEAQRIQLLGPIPLHTAHLAAYGEIDIALDTFPYAGTTTTCEALWMGVPVVTLAGEHHASRVGVSLLTNAGLSDWIANSADEYVEIAKRHATDLTSLSQLRSGLRERMQNSPLCDAKAFAADFEAALSRMVREPAR